MKWMMLLAALLASGCGLSDDLAVFKGRACNSVCGPCDLGKWDCETKSCDVSFDGVDEQAKCSGSDAQVVFVNAESEGGDGSKAKPFKTIQEAFERSKVRVVLVAGSSSYKGPITLVDGVTLQGGWSKDWTPEQAQEPIIRTEVDTDGHIIGVIAKNLDRTTTLKRLTIQNGTSIQGANIGLLAFKAKNLQLLDVTIIGNSAASGMNGEIGIDGAPGGMGFIGSVPQGGLGGDSVCNASMGGRGGNGERRSDGNQNIAAESGKPGGPSTMGGSPRQDGEQGIDGNTGSLGKDAGDGLVNVDSGYWELGSLATVGGKGTPGDGGGGGGGGTLQMNGVAGGGGGGGAGGCGGFGGQPGTSGWSAFGILATSSTLSLRQVNIQAGPGGAAGKGGLGGKGGAGGTGNVGAVANGALRAGSGGDGGFGGQGGRGGNGQAGISVGLYCTDSVLKQVSNLDISSGQGGTLPDGTKAEARDIFQCTMPK